MMGKGILGKLRTEAKDWPFSKVWTALKAERRVLQAKSFRHFKWFAKEITKVLFSTRMLPYVCVCYYQILYLKLF